MGVFKDIYDNFISKLQMDANLTEDGIRFNISTKKQDTSKSLTRDGVCQINMAGYGNPLGGIVITVLEAEDETSLLCPNIQNTGSMFVMLNGMLLPENWDNHGKVLWDYLKDKSSCNDVDAASVGLNKKYYRTVKKKLANGLSVTYWHIPASEMREFVKEDGSFEETLFLDFTIDYVVTRMMPENLAKILMVDFQSMHPFLAQLTKGANVDYPAERIVRKLDYDPDKCSSISNNLTEYIYTNILQDIKKEAEKTLNVKLDDIPCDLEGQHNFLGKLEKRLELDKWNQLMHWVA